MIGMVVYDLSLIIRRTVEWFTAGWHSPRTGGLAMKKLLLSAVLVFTVVAPGVRPGTASAEIKFGILPG